MSHYIHISIPYDELQVCLEEDGVTVKFYYEGKELYWNKSSHKIETGDTLIIKELSGTLEIDGN